MNHRELFENTVLLRPFDGLGAGVVLGRGPERLVPQRRRPEAEAVRANLEILGLGARGPDRGGHSANERGGGPSRTTIPASPLEALTCATSIPQNPARAVGR